MTQGPRVDLGAHFYSTYSHGHASQYTNHVIRQFYCFRHPSQLSKVNLRPKLGLDFAPVQQMTFPEK
jgi:hypothetical protein